MRISSTTPFILVIFLVGLDQGNGHLASVLDDDGQDVQLGGYTFRVHPKKGESKPPTMYHERRGVLGPMLLHRPLPPPSSKLLYLTPPHRHLLNNRLAFNSLNTHHNSPANSYNSMGSNSGRGSGTLSQEVEPPTFTPYISARALTDMEKFFVHMRENLEALQKGGSGEVGGGEDGGKIERRGETEEEIYQQDQTNESGADNRDEFNHFPGGDWKPMASGNLGIKKMSSFFPLVQNGELRTRLTNLGTNLGLGKKRRR